MSELELEIEMLRVDEGKAIEASIPGPVLHKR